MNIYYESGYRRGYEDFFNFNSYLPYSNRIDDNPYNKETEPYEYSGWVDGQVDAWLGALYKFDD